MALLLLLAEDMLFKIGRIMGDPCSACKTTGKCSPVQEVSARLGPGTIT